MKPTTAPSDPSLPKGEGSMPVYSHEEALAGATEYFEGDTLAAGVWVNKYALKDSYGNIYERTPDQMHRRIARELARMEQKYPNPLSEEEIYQLLARFRYIVPQGSPMAGIGNPFQVVSLSNCFVIGVEGSADSYGAILKIDEEQVQLMKRRGGVGHDLSHLRPKGTPVMNSALSSTGILPFMERYSNSTREVAQDGRRGALMLTISIQHPDSPDFVDAKLDHTKVTGANISLRIDDEFMRAAIAGNPYTLRFPIGSKKPLVERQINAADLWKKIVHNAWKSAEPGLLFWDTVIRESVPDCYADLGFRTVSTNPCLTADALVAVADGRGEVPIGLLAAQGLDVPVYCLNEQGKVEIQWMRNPRKTGAAQKVFKLTLDDGSTIKATANHEFRLKNGEFRRLDALKTGDSLMILTKFPENASASHVEPHPQPLSKGEGSRAQVIAYSQVGQRAHFSANKLDRSLSRIGSPLLWRGVGGEALRANGPVPFATTQAAPELQMAAISGGTFLTKTLEKAQKQGYFAQINENEVLVEKICEHCGKPFHVNYHRREIGFCSYDCAKESIRSNKRISVSGNILPKETSDFNHRVVSIEFAGYEDVFNGTVDRHHNFFAGGWVAQTRDGKEKRVYINQKNCGEIPLCPYDSCRLLAINLMSYVDDPFTANATLNFERLRKHAAFAQRFMDNIIDLELEKIERILEKMTKDPEPDKVKETEHDLWSKIKTKCLQGRRTGIGITAEGDMLAALGIRYGSPESLDFCENLHKEIALAVYRGSVNLARDRGAFPIFEAEREKNNPFIQRLAAADPQLYADMLQYGRRNIALLTIAPTGTTSLMTQTTSGLEPVFRISYKRRKKVNPNDRNVKVTFVDGVGDSWEDYHVFHIPFLQWLRAQGLDPKAVAAYEEGELQALIQKSPWYKASAEDVDWLSKVQLQGRVQKWVDHSISVTVNVPEDVDEALIEKIYRTGWEAGCKGMTVYREGSRSGVLVSDKKKDAQKDAFTETAAPKRPPVLDAQVFNFMNNDERWVAVIGMYDGKPYEIFTGRAVDSFSILNKVDEGKVIKVKENGKNRYDFQYTDKDGYKVTIEGLSRTFDKEYWNYARLISGILRHGMPMPYVVDLVENLHVESASLNSWKNGVVRTLRKFVADGTAPSHNQCPSCKTDGLVYQEGCLHCKNCGYSECT